MDTHKKFSYTLGAFLIASVFAPSFAHADTINCALEVNKPYRSVYSPSVYYVSADCTKRPVKDPDTYFSYFSSWNNVNYVSDALIARVPNSSLGFLPYGPNKVFEQGTILKSPELNKVYVLLNGQLHGFDSEESFLNAGYQWTWVQDVSSELIAKYSVGSEISGSSLPEGMLFKYQGSSEVYYIKKVDANYAKTYIASLDELKSLGYRADRIAVLPSTLYFMDDPTQNDVKRLSGIKQIQTALELYYSAHNAYPRTTVALALGNEVKCLNTTGFVSSENCASAYLSAFPQGPLANEYYSYVSDGSTYSISANLEKGASGYAAGSIIASPSGIRHVQ